MITEAVMTYEDMKKAVDNGYLCAKCQGRLEVAWGGGHGFNGYVLRCGNDIEHSGITRHDKKYEQKLKEGFSMDSNALMTMTEAKMLKRVEMARFPQDLTVDEKKLLAQVAISYGFDPLMGEVTIYQSRPWVSIDGRYRKAQETGQLDGVETRPANKQERIDWGILEGDYFFRAEVFVKDASHSFIGWGRVHKAETIGGKGFKPVEKNPQRMAEKRAEAQALRKAFHIPLPSVEDIGSPDYDIESTAQEVDTATSEITEGKAEKPRPKAERKQVSDAPESQKKPIEETKGSETPTEAEATTEKPSKVNEEWVKETLQIIKWKESTALSWIKAQLKVEGKDLMEVLNLLDRGELNVFVTHISSMRESAG